MKSLHLVIIALLLTLTTTLGAQELKFAHIDIQKLVATLPDKVKADKALQDEANKLQSQLKIMSEELDKKYSEYMSQKDSLPDLVKSIKEKEIQDQNQRIQNYNQLAQQSLGQKEQELLKPIIEKVQKAIDEVGAENGFIYIFDVSSKVILFYSDKSVDAEPLVRIKLGIQ
ncbi:MAG: OmpH family outer membrane protein [Breznakibacter sp.]|jgi:outer membrane protein|nr:OmpH family outer membrane protein [Breznakibacter sp.]